jgi:hypothetical protein
LFPFFLPAPSSSVAGVVGPPLAPEGPAQGLLTGVFRPLLSRRRPSPVYPGLKIVLLGLGAAGSAGNASAVVFGFLFRAVDEALRDGNGEGRALDGPEEDAHGVCPGFAPMRFDDTGPTCFLVGSRARRLRCGAL